ncbi:hypothetical protein BZA05DRAFT_341349 [Tricharina praecox]|uniref:uncharacterized protein n=1 Tax=Tricharina praecox TaxID=43433 RepID=UPI00222093B0|nr:uncharacterized protein BZA05DRAFT_341349 [Tricharina praecox]KAI5846855.1 hypothetical protein BZA05DRAFT_341349 [Tricharina praecox]
MPFPQSHLDIFERTSRISSAFSLVGASFIILTFCTSKNFHRPINRLAFYASFGNILTNAATIYSREGIRQGRESRMCQAQAAIIQWAIPADALFCLAMAWNVYLTVFRKKTTKQLRVLEPIYIILCYGIPLVPSLTFLFIGSKKGPIYGEATLWCWIDRDWQVLRIAAFYGPVWVVLAATFIIYVLAGRIIMQLRKNLRRFAKDPHSSLRESAVPRVTPGRIEVTTVDTVESATIRASDLIPRQNTPPGTFPGLTRDIMPHITGYTCHIEAIRPGRSCTPTARPRSGNSAVEANTAAWAYCRCAMLFFLALLITWLPSSINRLYNLMEPNASQFGLNFAAAMVLPAQGFWNGLIYVVTTLPACKKWFADIGAAIRDPVGCCCWGGGRRGSTDLDGRKSVASMASSKLPK